MSEPKIIVPARVAMIVARMLNGLAPVLHNSHMYSDIIQEIVNCMGEQLTAEQVEEIMVAVRIWESNNLHQVSVKLP